MLVFLFLGVFPNTCPCCLRMSSAYVSALNVGHL
jgi:hypothetical protein